ncbi:MAG: hypothetical protein IPK83_17020 [Planctomycetes bacterium]|nr:hypothetical protein [Planctomycetota bacterium]
MSQCIAACEHAHWRLAHFRCNTLCKSDTFMMTLCCTRRLLDYFDEKPAMEVQPEAQNSLLGCWYANMLWYGSTPLGDLCERADALRHRHPAR